VKSATLELAPFETAHVGGLQMRYLKRKREAQADQSSFVGGKPHLPEEQSIPTCELCGNSQSFMFQVAFPLDEIWGGRSIAVFFCVHCADEDFLVPEMLPDHLHECLIPDGFLTSYQRNFAFLVFPTAEAMIVRNYEEQVAFRAIEFVENRADAEFGKIGGSPEWELENEAPASYGAVAMEFLLQLTQGLEFDRIPGTRPQVDLDLSGRPVHSPRDCYQLFLGNAVYLFGTASGEPLVYAITQT
jgi:hypothetical protein